MRAPDPILQVNETWAREGRYRTDLSANDVGVLQGTVLRAPEVFGNGHALAIPHGKGELVGGGGAQLPDNARCRVPLTIGTKVVRKDANATDKPLQTQPFTVRETRQRGPRVICSEELQAKIHERALIRWLTKYMLFGGA
jgi:hypothetical protein